jgi:hypothetical protein
MMQPTTRAGRIARFFFMHIGGIVAVLVYFNIFGRSGYTVEGVARALPIAFTVMTVYAALAYSQGELKQLDVGLWLMFAVGALGSLAGVEPVLRAFHDYSPAILFTTLGTTATIPLLLGREPFTAYFTRRQIPAWQQKLPETHAITRLMAWFWVLVFAGAAALAVSAPADPRFTTLYPNLVVFLVGYPAVLWLPALYLRLVPPTLPQAVEPLLMSMPFAFNPKAAGDARATIQFRVSGPEAGDYHVRVAGGRCQAFQGVASTPDLTVFTPDNVWRRIAHGELDGGDAFAQGLFTAEGDVVVLTKLTEWFPTTRR